MKRRYSTSRPDGRCKTSVPIRSFAVTLLLFAQCLHAAAQGEAFEISGAVRDPAGAPLEGVVVTVAGTRQSTVTKGGGTYSLMAEPGQSLTFSFPGFRSQTVRINQRTTIDITLTEDQTSLDELVVIGYGVQKRRDLVGAVEVMSMKSVEERLGGLMSVSRVLQGQIPGMTVTFSDGKPSRGATIRIRGAVTSIGQGGGVLTMVDGVETDISTVNPDDIESISVLKDASSTAIFGSRGTFGVVLMTTKSSKSGTATVTYNGTFTAYQRATTPQMVSNGLQWTDSFLESYTNVYDKMPNTINNVFRYSKAWHSELARRDADPSFEKWSVNSNGLYDYYGNTSWYDVFYKSLMLGHQHSLTVTGGSDKATYYVSGRVFEQEGLYNAGDQKYRQLNVKSRGTIQVRPWLKIENSTSFFYRTKHEPMFSTSVSTTPQNVVRMLNHQGFPMAIVTNPDGTWTETAVYTGWAAFVEGTSWRKDRKFDMTNRTAVRIDFLKDVLFGDFDVSYYFNNTNREQAVNNYTYYKGPETTGQRPSGTIYEERYYNRGRVVANATLTFTPRIGANHSLSVLGGWNVENYDYKTTKVNREGIIIPEKPNFGLLDGESMTIADNGSQSYGVAGMFYRVSYAFKGKYLAEISGRYDGNSKLMSNDRWGYHPSASLGWRISEESFLRQANWLDNLKLRLSLGTSGNALYSNWYAFQSTMNVSRSSLVSGGSQLNYTSAPTPVPKSLTWEKVTTYNIGLDMEAFNGRLNMSADLYRKNTTDMYVKGDELPAVYGNDPPKGNYADMRTDGWEFSVSWRNSHRVGGKDLFYSVRVAVWDSWGVITRYTSKTNTLPTNYTTNYYEGMQIGELWGYVCNGLFQTNEEAATYADYSQFDNNNVVWQAGDPKYEDLNGDGAVNNGKNTIDDHGDLVRIGNTTPRYSYSLTGSVSWNGIGLSMMWQGVGKRDWYPAKESGYFWGQYGRPYSIALPWHTTDRWSEDNPGAYWPRLVGYSAQGAARILAQPNTRYLQSARYIRLKNLTLDYSFPQHIAGKIGLRGLKVFVSGENLLTFTPLRKYAKNYDPENIYPGDSDIKSSSGADNSGDGDGYPVMRSVTLGLTITF